MPAFATSRSIGPAASSIRSTSARLETSPTTAAPPISAATASTCPPVRPVTVTCQPAPASSRARLAPMPRPPPVTRALDGMSDLRGRGGYVHGVCRSMLAPAQEQERYGQRLEAGADHVRGAVAPDIGRLAQGGLDEDASGVAHQGVEREHRRSLLGRDHPVQIRLPDRHHGGEDETPEDQEEESEREAGRKAEAREQQDARCDAGDQRRRATGEEAPDPRRQIAAENLSAG